MRGTKLMAWRVPPVMQSVIDGTAVRVEDSMVPLAQERLCEVTRYALASVAADVAQGLRETIGLKSEWYESDRAAVLVHLPQEIDPQYAARAIDLENLEAWLNESGQLCAAIGPWYTTKEIDQVILCVAKVLHEFTGLLDVDPSAHGHTH